MQFDDFLVLIKGAGDLATGVAWRLHQCGFPVVMTERALPLTVRRTVAFAQAVFSGETTVEGVTARRCLAADVPDVLYAQEVPVLVDPEALILPEIQPVVLVDAIMAKRNMGTYIDQAPLVVALGPGFTTGDDCHAVVETHRGHRLGRVIWQGAALPDTGEPGNLPGIGVVANRVLRAPATGRLVPHAHLGDRLAMGDTIAIIEHEKGSTPLLAPFAGLLRGLIHEQVPVTAGLKIGDLDPRLDPDALWTISDKSLAVAGGVLEAILSWQARQSLHPSSDLDESYL